MCDCCGWCLAVAQGLGLWSSPVEGQLPSSLETTPTDVLVAAGEAGGSSTWGRHASKCPQAAALDRGKQREHSSTQEQQQQQHRSDATQPGRVRQPLAVVPSVTPAAQNAPDEDMQPPPTVVLSDVPAVACSGAGRQQGAAAAHGSTSQRATHTSSNGQQQHAVQQHASAREPLRWVLCLYSWPGCVLHVSNLHNHHRSNLLVWQYSQPTTYICKLEVTEHRI